jgi:hypothetical protein
MDLHIRNDDANQRRNGGKIAHAIEQVDNESEGVVGDDGSLAFGRKCDGRLRRNEDRLALRERVDRCLRDVHRGFVPEGNGAAAPGDDPTYLAGLEPICAGKVVLPDSTRAAAGGSVSAMPWSRQLSAPIMLKDGRRLASLGDARQMMASIPDEHRTALHWQHAAVMLTRAAQAKCGIDEAQMQIALALKAEGLL